MYSDYQCMICNKVELIHKPVAGEGFPQYIEVDCTQCKTKTNYIRLFSAPVISISEGFDKEFGMYAPASLTPMNKIEHFNKHLGRTKGVETDYHVSNN